MNSVKSAYSAVGVGLYDALAVADHVSLHLHDLAGVGVRYGHDASLSFADVSSLEGSCVLDKMEAVREMDKLEEISIDGCGEDGLHDSLKTHRQTVRLPTDTMRLPASQ